MSRTTTTTCNECGYDKPKPMKGWHIPGSWIHANAPGWPLNTPNLTELDFCSLACAVAYLTRAEKTLELESHRLPDRKS